MYILHLEWHIQLDLYVVWWSDNFRPGQWPLDVGMDHSDFCHDAHIYGCTAARMTWQSWYWRHLVISRFLLEAVAFRPYNGDFEILRYAHVLGCTAMRITFPTRSQQCLVRGDFLLGGRNNRTLKWQLWNFVIMATYIVSTYKGPIQLNPDVVWQHDNVCLMPWQLDLVWQIHNFVAMPKYKVVSQDEWPVKLDPDVI